MNKRVVVLLAALLLASLWGVARLVSEGTEEAAAEERSTAPSEEPASTAPSPLARPERETLERVPVVDIEPSVAPVEEPASEVAGEPVDVALCRLRGTLLDDETGRPLPGFTLRLPPVFGRTLSPPSATTDARGTFELDLPPGERVVLHVPDAGLGEASVAREVAPHRIEIACADGAPCERVLRARGPAARLEVAVAYADGKPAQGAEAMLVCGTAAQPFADTRARTDAEGRAVLGVWDPREMTEGRVLARDGEGHVSDVVPVDTPFLPGLRRLVLARGAELELRLLRVDGTPAGGRRVLLTHDTVPVAIPEAKTDVEGRARFMGLFAGRHGVRVWLPEENDWRVRSVELARGEARLLELTLGDPSVPVAVRGHVLDEDGRPLAGVGLAVALDDEPAEKVYSVVDGEFVCRAPRAARVRVDANVAQQGDRFDPPAVDVAFGTQDVVFRRAERAVPRAFEVEVVDAMTGEEVEHFVATIDRGPGTESWADSYAPRRRFELRLLADTRWRVASHGYLVRELALLPAVDALQPGERLRVELERGLDADVRVLDAETLEPLADVLFRSPTAGDARTDERGRVQLRADHWSKYAVTREGYGADEWDPDLNLLWAWGPLLLVRDS